MSTLYGGIQGHFRGKISFRLEKKNSWVFVSAVVMSVVSKSLIIGYSVGEVEY